MLLWINGAQLPSNLLIRRKEAREREEERHKIRKESDGGVWRGKKKRKEKWVRSTVKNAAV